MNRTKKNYIVDVLAFFGFALLTSTGLLMHFMLPPGSGRWKTLWGMDRHEWGEIHFYISLGLLAILAIHLALHWKWIYSVTRGRDSEHSGARFALGVLGFLAIIAVAFSPLLGTVEQSDDGGGWGRRRHHTNN